MNRIELAHSFFQHGSQRYDHDDLGKFRRLDADGTDGNPTLSPQRRLPHQHNGQQHDEIEYIELVAITLQRLIVKIHQEGRKSNIHRRKKPLPGHIPIPLFTGSIDMGGTADDDKTHDDDTGHSNQQGKVCTA